MRALHLASLATLVACAGAATAQELPQPTTFHQQLARDVGDWEAKVTMWPMPGMDPVVSSGKETSTMLGGFWLLSDFEGDFQGMPFTGRSQLGYDTETGEYVSTWIDSMAPAMFVSRGKYDVATNTLTLEGECNDWITGEPERMKHVTKYTDETHKTFEMYEAPAGSDDWHKSLMIEYTKK